MSSNYINNWAPYSVNLEQNYTDFTDPRSNAALNEKMLKYRNASINLYKVYTDISYCLNYSLVKDISNRSDLDGIPFRDFSFNDGGSLHLPINSVDRANQRVTPPTRVVGGNESQYISFDLAYSPGQLLSFTYPNIAAGSIQLANSANNTELPNSFCATLFNNKNQNNRVDVASIPNVTGWITDVSHGLYDYVYYEYNQARQDLENYLNDNAPASGKRLTINQLSPLMDLDTTYKGIKDLRKHLDDQMQNLYEVKNSIPHMNRQQYDATIFTTILWTVLAIMVLYYVFMKL
jgi:hypothetical protein